MNAVSQSFPTVEQPECSPMTLAEATRTNEAIRAGIVAVRALLLDMRDRRGWMALGYGSFEEYGKAELGYEERYINRLVTAEKIQNALGIGPIGPITESHLRPLASLTDEERRKVWAEATAKAEEGGRKLTAKMVEEAKAALEAEKQARAIAEQRSDEWRAQAIAKEKDLKAEKDAAALKAKEFSTLRAEIGKTAERMAADRLSSIKADLDNALIDKAEAEAKLKTKTKAMAEHIAQGIKQGLQAQQDEINRREAQLQAIEGRIATLNARLDAVNEQDQAVAHFDRQAREIRKSMDALSLHLTHAFDQDFAKFLPAPFLPVFERLASDLLAASDDIRKALGYVEIRPLEVSVHE